MRCLQMLRKLQKISSQEFNGVKNFGHFELFFEQTFENTHYKSVQMLFKKSSKCLIFFNLSPRIVIRSLIYPLYDVNLRIRDICSKHWSNVVQHGSEQLHHRFGCQERHL